MHQQLHNECMAGSTRMCLHKKPTPDGKEFRFSDKKMVVSLRLDTVMDMTHVIDFPSLLWFIWCFRWEQDGLVCEIHFSSGHTRTKREGEWKISDEGPLVYKWGSNNFKDTSAIHLFALLLVLPTQLPCFYWGPNLNLTLPIKETESRWMDIGRVVCQYFLNAGVDVGVVIVDYMQLGLSLSPTLLIHPQLEYYYFTYCSTSGVNILCKGNTLFCVVTWRS